MAITSMSTCLGCVPFLLISVCGCVFSNCSIFPKCYASVVKLVKMFSYFVCTFSIVTSQHVVLPRLLQFRPRPTTLAVTNLEVLWPTSPCVPSAFRPGGWDWTAGGQWCQAACCHSQSTPLQAQSAPTRCRWRAAEKVWPPQAHWVPGHWQRWHWAPSLRTGNRLQRHLWQFGHP